MKIGGIDIVIRSKRSLRDLDFEFMDSIRRHWPESQARYVHQPKEREAFIYRDRASLESWEKEGAVEENRNTMVHLLFDVYRLTIVVDDPKDPTMASMIAGVKDVLAKAPPLP